MMQIIKSGIAHHLAKYGVVLLSVETFLKTSLAQEKLQSADFASFTKVVGKICNVFCDQIV